MTVAELIEILKQKPQDIEVCTRDDRGMLVEPDVVDDKRDYTDAPIVVIY